MIVYLDTSALVPLLVSETGSSAARTLWNGADHVILTRLAHVEASAALAAAERADRLTTSETDTALVALELLWAQADVVELDDALMRRASQLAREAQLCGYDAVHCAAAETLHDDDLVAASGDAALLRAWRRLGLQTADVLAAPSP